LASSLDKTRLFKMLREHFFISMLKRGRLKREFNLLVILTASLKYLDSFVSNKHVLCTFLLVKKSENTLAGA
jgi:hypothetical protein